MALSADVGRRFRDIFDPFEDFFRTMPPTTGGVMMMRPGASPSARMEVIDKSDYYEVNVELPGIPKENIKVHVDGNRLFVQANKSEERHGDDDRLYLCERFFGTIHRTIEMPSSVDPGEVRATFENGMLRVLVGKRESDLGGGKLVPIQ